MALCGEGPSCKVRGEVLPQFHSDTVHSFAHHDARFSLGCVTWVRKMGIEVQ